MGMSIWICENLGEWERFLVYLNGLAIGGCEWRSCL